MSDEQKIHPRPGLEVFTNKTGTITIKQIAVLPDDEQIVTVHPEDVSRLIAMLERERDLR